MEKEWWFKRVVYDMPATKYHADPCCIPSLSSTMAKHLWSKTPIEAFKKHPRLNKDLVKTFDRKFDAGSASHAMLSGDEDLLEVIDANDYKTDKAKAAWTKAHKEDKVPILKKKLPEAKQMLEAIKEFIPRTEIGSLEKGRFEVSMFAFHTHMGAQLRSRLDWLADLRDIILDYKVTEIRPDRWGKHACNLGYDIQAAHYHKVNYLTGGKEDAKFFWLVQSPTAPYLCYLAAATPQMMAFGKNRLKFCEALWADCLRGDHWPGYTPRTHWVDAPEYEVMALEERQLENSSEHAEKALGIGG